MATTKASQKAVNKWNKENYDRMDVRVPKGKKDLIQTHATSKDGSLNKFINRAIDETIERDKKQK